MGGTAGAGAGRGAGSQPNPGLKGPYGRSSLPSPYTGLSARCLPPAGRSCLKGLSGVGGGTGLSSLPENKQNICKYKSHIKPGSVTKMRLIRNLAELTSGNHCNSQR